MFRITSLVKGLFIFSFGVYVISVSWFSWQNMNAYFYFLKHLSALVPAAFFIFFILKRPTIHRRIVAFPFLFMLLIVPFLIRGSSSISEMVIFLQLLFFIVSCYVFSKIFLSEKISFTKGDIFLMSAVLFLPPALDVIFNGSDFIYNTYYGRPRLLLGFYHPKEAGISLLVVAILLKIYIKEKLPRWVNLVLQLCVMVLLHFMQSRNSLLFYFNFLLIDKLLAKVNVLTVVFMYFVLPIITFSTLVMIYFEEINQITSNRLVHWLKNFDLSIFGKGSSIADFDKSNVLSKLHVDNFYLEYLIENGLIFFLLLIGLLFTIVFFLGKNRFNGVHINALLISFIIFCFFDAGMFSSGNFLNLLIWAIVFAALRNKSRVKGTMLPNDLVAPAIF